MTERKTDLAMEVRESFPRDNVEIKGVVLEKRKDEKSGAKVTVVEIKDDKASKAMKKPKGTYITIESERFLKEDEDNEELLLCICRELERMVAGLRKKRVLIAGLGNRHVTSDSLGPRMVEEIFVTRHFQNEFGEGFMKKNQYGNVSAIAPGVMGQTGMEAGEVLKGIVEKTQPELVIVVDALAARSLARVCTTVQLTDTGISPGSGIGNVRKALSKESLGVPVVAVGIPTVVDARTIISDHLEQVLTKQGYREWEREQFIREVLQEETKNLFVTPKNVDESVSILAKGLAKVMNYCLQKKCQEYFEENTDTL
ncbi:MAG TPA: GPR endopeptidase [Lachnospiraceae bacterium]|nr:GPR endopeptidase [Lachnospiraceae bacterium]